MKTCGIDPEKQKRLAADQKRVAAAQKKERRQTLARIKKEQKQTLARKKEAVRQARLKQEEETRRGFVFRPLFRVFRGKRLICRITAAGERDEILVSRLAAQNLPLLSLKRAGGKTVLEICAEDRVKVIAILGGLCYTVLRTDTRGILAPFYLAARRLGALLGAAAFLALSYAAKPLVLAVEYRGGAAYLQEELSCVLRENGVAPFRFAAKSALERAENRALASFRSLSSVSVEKRGFVVTVTAEADPLPVFPEKPQNILSDREGTVLSVTVLRGKAGVCPGDAVRPGTVLIAGILSGKEQEKPSFAAGEVVLSCKYDKRIVADKNNAHYLELLRLNALKETGAQEIKSDLCRVEEKDGKYVYVIEFTYVFVVRGGY